MCVPARLLAGKQQELIGGGESYKPACRSCYNRGIAAAATAAAPAASLPDLPGTGAGAVVLGAGLGAQPVHAGQGPAHGQFNPVGKDEGAGPRRMRRLLNDDQGGPSTVKPVVARKRKSKQQAAAKAASR